MWRPPAVMHPTTLQTRCLSRVGLFLALAFLQASPTRAQFVQQGPKLVGTGAIGHARQGNVALSADGNTAIVGGALDDGGQGAAWIYRRVGNSWIEQAKLVGSG